MKLEYEINSVVGDCFIIGLCRNMKEGFPHAPMAPPELWMCKARSGKRKEQLELGCLLLAIENTFSAIKHFLLKYRIRMELHIGAVPVGSIPRVPINPLALPKPVSLTVYSWERLTGCKLDAGATISSKYHTSVSWHHHRHCRMMTLPPLDTPTLFGRHMPDLPYNKSGIGYTFSC